MSGRIQRQGPQWGSYGDSVEGDGSFWAGKGGRGPPHRCLLQASSASMLWGQHTNSALPCPPHQPCHSPQCQTHMPGAGSLAGGHPRPQSRPLGLLLPPQPPFPRPSAQAPVGPSDDDLLSEPQAVALWKPHAPLWGWGGGGHTSFLDEATSGAERGRFPEGHAMERHPRVRRRQVQRPRNEGVDIDGGWVFSPGRGAWQEHGNSPPQEPRLGPGPSRWAASEAWVCRWDLTTPAPVGR